MFFVFDSKREKLHSCHTLVGFGSDQQVQIGLLCTRIAVSRGDGSVNLTNLARSKPAGVLLRRDDNFTPRLHGRSPEGSVRSS